MRCLRCQRPVAPGTPRSSEATPVRPNCRGSLPRTDRPRRFLRFSSSLSAFCCRLRESPSPRSSEARGLLSMAAKMLRTAYSFNALSKQGEIHAFGHALLRLGCKPRADLVERFPVADVHAQLPRCRKQVVVDLVHHTVDAVIALIFVEKLADMRGNQQPFRGKPLL